MNAASAADVQRTFAAVDLVALRKNARQLTQRFGAICAVVKADAYGHGLVPCARAAVAGGVAAIAVAGAVFGKLYSRTASARASAGGESGSKKIIEGAAIKVGATHTFISKAGTPAVLFRTKTGVFAYSAVCTHQGCTVAFDSASEKLQCGCHGAVFDPFDGAKVVTGPTNQPLAKITVATEGAWIVES